MKPNKKNNKIHPTKTHQISNQSTQEESEIYR